MANQVLQGHQVPSVIKENKVREDQEAPLAQNLNGVSKECAALLEPRDHKDQLVEWDLQDYRKLLQLLRALPLYIEHSQKWLCNTFTVLLHQR